MPVSPLEAMEPTPELKYLQKHIGIFHLLAYQVLLTMILFGTEVTIGFDTAVNTAVQAIDKIRDTAHSHDRLFFIEVMGRHAGFIALHTGIGIGASSIFVPEGGMSIEKLVDHLHKSEKRNKLFNMIVVAEGNKIRKCHRTGQNG